MKEQMSYTNRPNLIQKIGVLIIAIVFFSLYFLIEKKMEVRAWFARRMNA